MLEAAHIHDDEYFSHLVNEDIDRIIRDLREKHRKDITSAPEVSVAQQMKKDLDEVANFKGSRLEKQMISNRPDGNKPVFNAPDTEENESLWIADTILNNVAKNMKYSDHTILVRAASQT